MSIRAYKVIEIKHNPDPTFNCWHDYEIVKLASNPETYGENGGILMFEEEVVKDALNNEQDEEKKEILNQILKDMANDGYVEYFCF